MDTQRLILFAAFMLLSMSLWQTWQIQVNPPPTISNDVTAANTGSANQTALPTKDDIPAVPVSTQQTQGAVSSAPSIGQKLNSGQRVSVKTDVFDIEIDTIGGDIRRVALLQYPNDVNEDPSPVILMNDKSGLFFISQTGLLSSSNDSYAPDHNINYQISKLSYEMGEQSELKVPLNWTSDDGKFTLTKIYTFTPGNYEIAVEHQITNNSENPWNGHLYRQLQRTSVAQQSMFLHTYTGAMISKEVDGFEKIDFPEMLEGNLSRPNTGGWVAMIQHHFMGVWVPPQNSAENYYTRVTEKNTADPHYIVGTISPAQQVNTTETIVLKDSLFIGPKLQNQIKKIAPGIDSTVDYGFLSVIAHPIYWLLEKIQSVVNNWGWSIIFLTIIIKAIFYKLSAVSYKSMAHMRKVTPRLKALQEQFKDDSAGKNKAMMELYKKEKINPLGGCLPILVQIPVFIALYWVLLESVEMRQADFMLWLNNLSAPDPYYVLPLIMGVSMFVQQKLNPAPMDPVQAKVMMMLPIIFTVFFAFFPSGLVLYWVVNNLLSIAQQWYITRSIENA
ncbi:MAG: membrane protein insertase YidC [gamma proteobacterium symbiont of Bathyaustriella thionipta]|nr:membrane protein insertase YidC [gamma proteobacterium symbiont of Bathyaustriella thionipta]MCU7949381.1 membrane protein insertase YidC [gamma proteobacterium symbiont of Bathyaustriella thionipta]MCU7952517.1 membrane protein insertase YidC [gamma proteobacterium symbiont of Bathyaustriella thionipta]MCU7955975.1 membrane protein insertase YidC [gamma proteobacterium symbiont of Bathyaustriella thionipta]MCU7967052.1 membrane protein insertase YidC [gamma proteobacterium symbiont of Bathy